MTGNCRKSFDKIRSNFMIKHTSRGDGMISREDTNLGITAKNFVRKKG